ncbi:hypothetical protein [Motiliproteus sediminis]|nr:hypothetical protein [Motiliproteus sediminis]
MTISDNDGVIAAYLTRINSGTAVLRSCGRHIPMVEYAHFATE